MKIRARENHTGGGDGDELATALAEAGDEESKEELTQEQIDDFYEWKYDLFNELYVNAARFIHAQLMNPSATTSQSPLFTRCHQAL